MNISGGTEVGACFLSPHVVEPLSPCSFGGPALGMAIDVFDDEGHSVRGRGTVGELVCTKPWPGMTRGLYGDPAALSRDLLVALSGRVVARRFRERRATTGNGSCTAVPTTPSRSRASGWARPRSRRSSSAHPAVLEAAAVGVPDDAEGRGVVGVRRCPSPGVEFRTTPCAASWSRAVVDALGPTFKPAAGTVHDRAAEDAEREGVAARDPIDGHRRRAR